MKEYELDTYIKELKTIFYSYISYYECVCLTMKYAKPYVIECDVEIENENMENITNQ